MTFIPWNITGSPNQQFILHSGFERFFFPLNAFRAFPAQVPECGWRDLNSSYSVDYVPIEQALALHEHARQHGGKTHDGLHEDRPDPYVIQFEGKSWVAGVIYPYSGRIYLDYRLEANPEVAMAVLAAELAHAIDFYLPMADAQRNELLRLWNVPGTTWWEIVDYSKEYFRLGGEAWMHEVVLAYTNLDFGDKSRFTHDAGVEPEDVWRILGFMRTDAAPLPEPIAEPVPVNEPVPVGPVVEPSPIPGIKHYSGGPDIYHKLDHAASRKRYGEPVYDLTGFRPCKICKPQL